MMGHLKLRADGPLKMLSPWFPGELPAITDRDGELLQYQRSNGAQFWLISWFQLSHRQQFVIAGYLGAHYELRQDNAGLVWTEPEQPLIFLTPVFVPLNHEIPITIGVAISAEAVAAVIQIPLTPEQQMQQWLELLEQMDQPPQSGSQPITPLVTEERGAPTLPAF
jgi:hypothetical protein